MPTNLRPFEAAKSPGGGLEQHILLEALDKDGRRYDAGKLAQLLDWSLKDMGAYLDKDPSTVSRFSASAGSQDALAALAALVLRMKNLFGSVELAATWTRTPARALDGASPKQLILSQNLSAVNDLLDEMEAGLAL